MILRILVFIIDIALPNFELTAIYNLGDDTLIGIK